jgi:phosphoribosylamine--glycine ligase
LFAAMIRRSPDSFPIRPGFSLCVVLTTPPFPYSRHQVEAPVGMPVVVGNVPTDQLHLGEVGSVDAQLVTSGVYGWTAVVTGTAATIGEAKAVAYRNASQVQAPSLRYRLDIGDEVDSGGLQKLIEWGWLPETVDKKGAAACATAPLSVER